MEIEKKKKQWLWPLLLIALLVGGLSCKDDDEEVDFPKYQIIELNMEDNRFENLPTISLLTDVSCQLKHGDLGFLLVRNDSVFISYYGTLLYPTRLPKDFPVYGNPFVFSGTVKKRPGDVDYYPLIVERFKYELLQEMIN